MRGLVRRGRARLARRVPGRPSPRAALLGHYLTFVVSIEIANVQYWVLGRKVLWTGEAPIDPLSAFLVSPLYALLSLAMLGWLTLPSGAVLGALFGHAMRRRASAPIDVNPGR